MSTALFYIPAQLISLCCLLHALRRLSVPLKCSSAVHPGGFASLERQTPPIPVLSSALYSGVHASKPAQLVRVFQEPNSGLTLPRGVCLTNSYDRWICRRLPAVEPEYIAVSENSFSVDIEQMRQ